MNEIALLPPSKAITHMSQCADYFLRAYEFSPWPTNLSANMFDLLRNCGNFTASVTSKKQDRVIHVIVWQYRKELKSRWDEINAIRYEAGLLQINPAFPSFPPH